MCCMQNYFCLMFKFATISILTLQGHYITTSEFHRNFMMSWYHKYNPLLHPPVPVSAARHKPRRFSVNDMQLMKLFTSCTVCSQSRAPRMLGLFFPPPQIHIFIAPFISMRSRHLEPRASPYFSCLGSMSFPQPTP